jgi:hypothetical protein
MNTQDPQIKPNNDGVEQGEILPDPLPHTQAQTQAQPAPHPVPSIAQTPPELPKTQSQPSTEPSVKPKGFDPKNMASLAGLDFEDPVASAIVTTEQEENIGAAKTRLPIYKQSLFKTIAIGGSFLIATLAAGKLIFPGAKEEVAATPKTSPSPVEKPKADFAPDPRFGVVSSKLAMNDQSKQILDAAAAQQSVTAAQAATPKNGALLAASGTAAAPGTANAAKIDSNPEVIKNSSPPPDLGYQAPPSAQPMASPAPVAAAPKPVVPPVTSKPVAVASKPDLPHGPVEPSPKPIAVVPKSTPVAPVVPQPVKIATRQIPASVPQLPSPTPAKAPVTWEIANRNAVGLWNRTAGDAPAVAATVPTPQKVAAPKPKIASARTVPAAVGQQIKSKLVIPYQSPVTAPTQLIFIGLSTPVLDIRGEVLLPAGTQIMCEVAAMDNGMLQVFSAKASIDGQLIDLPKNSIMLQDASKQPLIAQLKTFGQGEVFNRDMYAIAGNVATAIGQNLTQPQTQTIASNGGIVQSTNPSINIPGAALSGFAPVVSQWMQRNQSAVTQINAASKIWFLPTGTDVNLIVAQSFTL